MGAIAGWKARARSLRRDTIALYLAARDPRVPWYTKGVALLILAYARSPIDLIPDFIPVVGYVDDLVIVPAGLLLVRRMIPEAIFEEHRRDAETLIASPTTAAKVGAALIVLVWLAALGAVLLLLG